MSIGRFISTTNVGVLIEAIKELSCEVAFLKSKLGNYYDY
jgi:hypothetical protein